jgi:hypothetical protein
VRNGTPCKFIASASASACDRAIVLPPRHFAGVAPTPPRSPRSMRCSRFSKSD